MVLELLLNFPLRVLGQDTVFVNSSRYRYILSSFRDGGTEHGTVRLFMLQYVFFGYQFVFVIIYQLGAAL